MSGFRGGPGGGRGGFGGPKPYDDAQPIIQYVQNRLPINTAPDYARLKKEYGLGWHDLPEDLNDVQVQKYNKAPATKFKEKIDLSVNWFPLQKFKVPERIFHYEVTIERVKEPKKDAPNPKPTKVEKKGQGTRAEAAQVEAPQQRRLPKPLPQLILQRVISEIKRTKNFHGIVSDLSNNVYASRQLESLGIDLIQTVRFKDLDQEILQEDDDGSVKVTLARTDLDVDPGSLRALNEHLAQYGTWKGYDMDVSVRTVVEQVYSAFVKSLPPYRFIPVGKSNLVRWSGEESSLGDNVVCWKGLSANISMGWKPYLNVNVEHCPFLEGKNIVDAIASLMRFNGSPVDIRNWRQWQFREATSLLKNIKVWYVAGGRKFSGPIFSVLQTSIGQTMFPYNDRTISVRDYFQQVYRENLDAGHICLALRGGRAQVPAELCTIKLGQSYNRKLNEQQTSKMLVVAKKNPDVLHKEIMDQVGNLALSGPVADDWGVNVSKDMLRLKDARVLKPPQLFYGEAIGMNQGKGLAVITPQDGSWSINQASFKFFEPVSITEWGILVANCNIHDLSNFRRLLIRNGVDNGVIFQNQNPTEEYIGGLEDVKDNFEKSRSNVEKLRKCFENFKAKKCQIVFVIVPKKNSAIYCHVKQAAELGPDSKGLGVLTQCVVALNVDKGQPATINNILLKVNSKLGGKNYIMRPPEPIKEYFNLIDCPTLIMGADVMHPPPGAGRKIMVDGKEVLLPSPSFAAVTGSLDRTGMPFMMDIKAQMKAGRGAAEVIQGLGESVMKLLQGFRAKSRLIPRKIIYFRDGVGEGQFPELLHIELRAIRNVCETLKDHDGEPYRPKITFVTVQKRHKTRFFYHSPRGIINAPAGTVVDREIVHQVHDDFYLLSHKGMMGTSRPTHYRVLWDDSDFTADEIQHLTYYLCYMYVRCRKSVKIPAPTYYAHWAAARAKALADGMELQFNTPEELTAYMKRHPDLMKNAPMHFV
ncbi:Protein argonaute-2 [Orchesella cincta]|uniref:Protein argonaute-2 n=1 Tax=Orchesella cincta TaxID=48709 RepID=A0A1D2M599_ORCCI|nr:Protein argonaute-2 [Orchesella cincta]